MYGKSFKPVRYNRLMSIVGIDSRSFFREGGNSKRFRSTLGVAVKVGDYFEFSKFYRSVLEKTKKYLKNDYDTQFVCFNDIKDDPGHAEFISNFLNGISSKIERIHIFYTLFSKKRIRDVKVYGRFAQRNNLKLSKPTRSYDELLDEHVLNVFPAICAWRMMEFMSPHTIEFHLDAFDGHTFEAYEELEDSDFKLRVYTGGDCTNPVISLADLFIELIDYRLKKQNKFLLFENFRKILPEFGDSVMVYPISNKHLPKITPLDKKSITLVDKLQHPVFWVFKGDDAIDSGTLKRSRAFRNLQDYSASYNGCTKLFDKKKDVNYLQEGDYGVFLNTRGEEQIKSYRMIGKKLKPFEFYNLVPSHLKT